MNQFFYCEIQKRIYLNNAIFNNALNLISNKNIIIANQSPHNPKNNSAYLLNNNFLQRKRNPDESINFFDKSIFFNEKINGNEFDAQLETNKIDTNSNSKDSIINGSTLIEKENKIENHNNSNENNHLNCDNIINSKQSENINKTMINKKKFNIINFNTISSNACTNKKSKYFKIRHYKSIKKINNKKNKIIKKKEKPLLIESETNNEIKAIKNNKSVYLNSCLLNSSSASRNLKQINKTTFISERKRRSKFRGVSKNGNQWQVLLMHNKGKSYVGSYSSEEFAAKIYDILAIKLRGIKARTNFKYTYEQIKKIVNLDFDIKSKNINDIVTQFV